MKTEILKNNVEKKNLPSYLQEPILRKIESFGSEELTPAQLAEFEDLLQQLKQDEQKEREAMIQLKQIMEQETQELNTLQTNYDQEMEQAEKTYLEEMEDVRQQIDQMRQNSPSHEQNNPPSPL